MHAYVCVFVCGKKFCKVTEGYSRIIFGFVKRSLSSTKREGVGGEDEVENGVTKSCSDLLNITRFG